MGIMLRSFLPYTFVALFIALIYVGWTMWSRGRANTRIEQRLKIEEGNRDAKIVQAYGGDDLKILSFYASPAVIRRGQKALLCYGVNNATSVSIDPPVGAIAPSLSRCVEVRPSSTTSFTLTASDSRGRQLSQAIKLQVANSRESQASAPSSSVP